MDPPLLMLAHAHTHAHMPSRAQSDIHTELVHTDKNMQYKESKKCFFPRSHTADMHTHKHSCQFISLASDKWACQSVCLCQADKCVCACVCVDACLLEILQDI